MQERSSPALAACSGACVAPRELRSGFSLPRKDGCESVTLRVPKADDWAAGVPAQSGGCGGFCRVRSTLGPGDSGHWSNQPGTARMASST